MLKLGQYQKLTIAKKVEFGVYLAEEQDMEKRVLLPANRFRRMQRPGMNLKCFVQGFQRPDDRNDKSAKDHSWRACCFACGTGWKIGAFLDWGLEKICFFLIKR